MKTTITALLHTLLFVLPLLFSKHVMSSPSTPAPPLEIKLLDGRIFNLQAQRGKIIVINFWATWCEPCRQEMPVLDKLHKQYNRQGLYILGISVDDAADKDKVQAAIQAYGYDFAMLRDVTQNKLRKISVIPTTIIVEKDGSINQDIQPKPPFDAIQFENTIKALLAK